MDTTSELEDGGAADAPLLRLMWQRYQWLRSVAEAVMPAGNDGRALRGTHVTLLSQLPDEGTSGARLARRLGVRPPTVHQWVQELVHLGVLEVVDEQGSRRERTIRLTTRGREEREAALRALRQVESLLEVRIGAETMRQLRAALATDWGTEADTVAAHSGPGPRSSPTSRS
ncbi:MarR family winged helix-turn-helix transcriptional regulator [Curtobacterium aetherium]|uniref:hypothetical protein n=1 Tax=Curtobacterium aetherium TaxID=2841594 RepID=UPI003B52F71C